MKTGSPPLLQPSRFTEPFWDACRRGVLQAASCKDCGHLFLPAGPVCPQCWSDELGAQALSGYGEIAAFTVYRQSYHPDFPAPYVIALIALKEGPRLVSNVIGCAPEDVAIGMKVKVRFESRGEFVLPLFAPAEASKTQNARDSIHD
ncbi:MAG: Zn-ribbon domain-containing OB-fold protein [Parvularculaceae bacterium]